MLARSRITYVRVEFVGGPLDGLSETRSWPLRETELSTDNPPGLYRWLEEGPVTVLEIVDLTTQNRTRIEDVEKTLRDGSPVTFRWVPAEVTDQ